MRKEAIRLEEERFVGIDDIEEYPSFHERHRIFPAVFEDREHKKILDIAAGMGVVGQRIRNEYPHVELLCNDITPACLKVMQKIPLPTISFDIDDHGKKFPFPDNHFDAIIALATIEHLMNIDHFLNEINRILRNENGYFYISAPNYSGITYLLPFLISGKTFHDPMSASGRYEFYAHVKYFTYHTLLDVVASFGFAPVAVYLAIPEGSACYQKLKSGSKLKAHAFRNAMKFIYTFFSPRWAAEPVLCFKKSNGAIKGNFRKVIL